LDRIKKIHTKRVINNSSELNEYLTIEKINAFKKTIYEFLSISNEIDRKIIEITNNNSEYELNEFDIKTLINSFNFK
jgi:hypothetical protein